MSQTSDKAALLEHTNVSRPRSYSSSSLQMIPSKPIPVVTHRSGSFSEAVSYAPRPTESAATLDHMHGGHRSRYPSDAPRPSVSASTLHISSPSMIPAQPTTTVPELSAARPTFIINPLSQSYQNVETSPHTVQTLKTLVEENHKLREHIAEGCAAANSDKGHRASYEYRHLRSSHDVASHYEHKYIVDLARDVRMHRAWKKKMDEAEKNFTFLYDEWHGEKKMLQQKLAKLESDNASLATELKVLQSARSPPAATVTAARPGPWHATELNAAPRCVPGGEEGVSNRDDNSSTGEISRSESSTPVREQTPPAHALMKPLAHRASSAFHAVARYEPVPTQTAAAGETRIAMPVGSRHVAWT